VTADYRGDVRGAKTVGELRALLSEFPDDMPLVHANGDAVEVFKAAQTSAVAPPAEDAVTEDDGVLVQTRTRRTVWTSACGVSLGRDAQRDWNMCVRRAAALLEPL
jgi:hypothetical protein